ncbi:MAG: glycosyl hydrolase family 28-related protein [Polynucleobacter sp.]
MTIFSQQVAETAERGIKAPVTDPTSINMTLPAKADRIDSLLQFDLNGNPGVISIADLASGLSGAILGANYVTTNATGNGSTTAFTVSSAPGDKGNIQIYLDGVYQNKNTFSISGTTVTFTEAPPVGSAIEFVVGYSLGSTSGADAVTYTPAGVGAQTTTVQAKLRETVSVKDFGAVGDGVTDDTAAMQAAIDYCHTNFRTLYLPAGTYKLTSTITKASSFYGVNITGEGANNTILDFSSIATPNSPGLLLIGGSGSYPNNVMQKFTIKGNQNIRAIQFQGLGGQRVRDCTFENVLVGGYYGNIDAGSFTEFDVFENCRFNDDCWLAIEYARVSGNDSFHGSGLLNCVVGSSPTQLARVRINPGCHPYNAPMTAQFFMNGSIPIIEHNEPFRSAEFYGTITVETFSGTPTLATGYDIGLAGTVAFLGAAPNWGTLAVTRYQTSDVSGVLQSLDSMYVGQPTAINTSTFTDIYTPTGMVRGARIFYVYLSGTYVEATYMLLSLVSPFGFYPTPTLIGKSVCDNGGQSGVDPIFALNNTSSLLQIKQGAGPATDVTARIVVYQLGLGAANTGVL